MLYKHGNYVINVDQTDNQFEIRLSKAFVPSAYRSGVWFFDGRKIDPVHSPPHHVLSAVTLWWGSRIKTLSSLETNLTEIF